MTDSYWQDMNRKLQAENQSLREQCDAYRNLFNKAKKMPSMPYSIELCLCEGILEIGKRKNHKI